MTQGTGKRGELTRVDTFVYVHKKKPGYNSCNATFVHSLLKNCLPLSTEFAPQVGVNTIAVLEQLCASTKHA